MGFSTMWRRGNISGLYVITTESPQRSHIDIAKASIEAGVSFIQYRDKNASTRKLFETALKLREITRKARTKLIINDRVDIALAVKADGVHLGQDDMPLEHARDILGDRYIIGISTSCLEEAMEAERGGADYIGLGPIYPTPSKDDAGSPIGIEGLMAARESVDIPIVAIGGLTADNIEQVVSAGSDGIAVISAVASALDMAEASRRLNELIERAKRPLI